MRKIEAQMVNAIRNGQNWRLANTEVSTKDGVSLVYLHNNLIAKVTSFGVSLFDGGWQSVTTKSRLNAIINGLMDGVKFGVFQRDFQWYVTDKGCDVPFHNGYVLAY